jgi:hypothetical protein
LHRAERLSVDGRTTLRRRGGCRSLQELRVDYRAEEDTCVKCSVRLLVEELGGDAGGAEVRAA